MEGDVTGLAAKKTIAPLLTPGCGLCATQPVIKQSEKIFIGRRSIGPRRGGRAGMIPKKNNQRLIICRVRHINKSIQFYEYLVLINIKSLFIYTFT